MEHPGGTPNERDVTLGAGTRLGKYEIARLLGSGGMGAVYEATHTEIGKRVAIKVLSPSVAAIPGARARFLREAQLTSSLRHPNIVDVTDMGSDGGQTYLVMEFLRGEDLAQRLARTGPLGPQDLADIMLPVCSAVVEAHKAGITHRDLKPQNIFLALGPHVMQPKVLDFGISKGNDLSAGSLTGTGAMIGTPYYLAPEQIMDTRSSGPQSDQYALGVILYECLTGCRPFESENLFVVFQAIVAGQPLPPRQRRLDIPPALEDIVLRAMNVDPKARFPSIVALGRSLLSFASARMRSIWEEAFVAAVGDEAPESASTAAQVGSSVPLTPPVGATPPARATPPEKSKGAFDGQARATQPTRAFPAPNLFQEQDTPTLGDGRSRGLKRLVFFGVVIVGAAITALLALRPEQRHAGDSGPETKPPAVVAPVVLPSVAPVAKPVAAKSVVADPVVAEAVVAEPVVAEPVVAKPVAAKSVVAKPAVAKPSRAAASRTAPVGSPAKDSKTRRSASPKRMESRSLNPNGAPVID